ncbi:unnamed protein product, partial [Porites evermanni]
LCRDELVVHPSWILDSIKARVLLPATQYLLYQSRKAAQKVLNFASNSKSTSTYENTGHIGGDLNLEAPSLTLQEITSVDGKTATKASDSAVFKKPSTSGLPRAGDANFVSEFYNNSRLHYLSTWGAEFKKYTSEIIKSSAGNGWKGRGAGRVGPHGRVIMHIDMDSFFVSVTLRDQPHLRGKPIAVCHAGKGNSTDQGGCRTSSSFFNSMSEIASCSYEARAAGVRNGMFLGPARKLCPDIHCVPYQFEDYRQVS